MNNEKHEQGTHRTKMGANSLAEIAPNASIIYLSAQFVCPNGIFEKKLSLGVRSSCSGKIHSEMSDKAELSSANALNLLY